MPRPRLYDALVQRIAPGGRLLRRRRLHGGIGSIVHRLDIERADGTRQNVVLRRSAPEGDHAHVTPEKAAYEFGALQAIRKAGVSAPRPVYLDAAGELFGSAAIVLEYLPGRPRFLAGDADAFRDAMAAALSAVHSVTPDGHDLSLLILRDRDQVRRRIAANHGWLGEEPLALQVQAALQRHIESVPLMPPCLVHGDFWPGNVIWSRGRISGIVDWSGAAVGDPRTDLAEMRVDLVMSHGMQEADALTRAYERASGRRVSQLGFFDLYRGLNAYVECEHWLDGYYDLGMTHLTPKDVRARLAAFFERALTELAPV